MARAARSRAPDSVATVRQAAELLDITTQAVRNAIRDGRLRANVELQSNGRRSYEIDRESIERFAERRSSSTTATGPDDERWENLRQLSRSAGSAGGAGDAETVAAAVALAAAESARAERLNEVVGNLHIRLEMAESASTESSQQVAALRRDLGEAQAQIRRLTVALEHQTKTVQALLLLDAEEPLGVARESR